MVAVGGRERKICQTKGEKQQQSAAESQKWLSAAFFIFVGIDDFRDCRQGKDKRVNGKTFQDEVLGDKQVDDAAVQSAVLINCPEAGICNTAAE